MRAAQSVWVEVYHGSTHVDIFMCLPSLVPLILLFYLLFRVLS